MREQLELMKRAKTCPDYKKTDKPKHGGRKVFFHRLWCRIQRLPLPKNEKSSSAQAAGEGASGGGGSPVEAAEDKDKEELTTTAPLSPGGKDKKIPVSAGSSTPPPAVGSPEKKRKRKKSVDSTAINEKNRKSARRSPDKDKVDCDGQGSESDFEELGTVETVEFDNVHHNQDGSSIVKSPSREPTPSSTITAPTIAANNTNNAAANKDHPQILYTGRTRLTRNDDTHWLSESDCFIRQELAEIFTATKEDLGMFGDPEIGQVGVRCFYCAENKSVGDRGRGHVYFPRSVAGVQQVVSDLQRR